MCKDGEIIIHLIKLLAVSTLIFSFATSAEDNPYPFSKLSDCTDKEWEESKSYWQTMSSELEKRFVAVTPITDPEVKDRALSAATSWAVESGYLPCSFEMCGMVAKSKSNELMVYINPIEMQFVGPEATVAIKQQNYEAFDSSVFHSGCAQRRNRAKNS